VKRDIRALIASGSAFAGLAICYFLLRAVNQFNNIRLNGCPPIEAPLRPDAFPPNIPTYPTCPGSEPVSAYYVTGPVLIFIAAAMMLWIWLRPKQ